LALTGDRTVLSSISVKDFKGETDAVYVVKAEKKKKSKSEEGMERYE
jgi:hypothetical protein